MKKLLCIFLLLTLVAFALVACGGEQTPEHIHSFGEWDLTKKPTCTEDGTKVRYCDCGEKQSEIVVALGHTPKSTFITVDPTYESDGAYYEVVSCSTCGEKLSETTHKIPMLKHTPAEAVEENHISATCYAEGSYEMVVYCAECDAELERAKHTIPMIEHTPASAVEENYSDSTCYAEGSKDLVVYCSVAECRKELERNTETIGKKAHTPASAVEENRINPTYEKDGSYQLVIYCSVSDCHAELERTNHTLDMLVHHPGNMVVENEVSATCTKAGSYDEVVYCLDADCGHKELSRKTISVPVLAHTNGEAVEEKRVNASCYSEGSYDSVVYCSVCKTELSRSTVTLQKIAHTPASAVEENRVNATCYVEGSYDSVVYCSVCNTELSRSKVTLQKIAHTPAEAVVENRVEASCTTDGSYDEVVYCSVENCRVQISRATKIIAATGHAEVIDPAVEATCTETGLTEGKHCGVCNEVLVEQSVVGVIEHNYVNNVCTVCGSEYFSQGLEYVSYGDGTCYVLGIGTCNDTDIVIPSISPSGDVVKRIAGYAFEKCNFIKSIFIPETITDIGNYAFLDCTSINKVYIDNLVAWCNIDFGYKMKTSYGECIYECFSNPLYYAEKLYVNGEYLQSLKIPEGVTTIKEFAFYNADFTSVYLPSSIVVIGECAFMDCSLLKGVYITDLSKWCNIEFGYQRKKYDTDYYYCCESNPLYYAKKLYVNGEHLQSLEIPDGVTTIKEFAFYNADFTSVHIPSTVSAIEAYAFGLCSSLKGVYITDLSAWCNIDFAYDRATDEGVPYYESALSNPLQYAENLYLNDNKVTNLTIPTDVTKIKPYAFYCGNFSTANIANSVQDIGYCAFASSQIGTITFSDGLLYIYDKAFSNCKNISKLTLPDSLISIGKMSFTYCTNLTTVTFGSDLKYINYAAFGNCDKITSVSFKTTGGWRVDYENILSATLTSSALSNTATAAKYIKSTYMIYTWTRN